MRALHDVLDLRLPSIPTLQGLDYCVDERWLLYMQGNARRVAEMKLWNVSIWKTCQVCDLFYIHFNPIASTPPKSFLEVQKPIALPAHTHTPLPLLLSTTTILLANDHQMWDKQILGPQSIANGPWHDHSTMSSNTYMDGIQTYCYGNICLSQLSCIANIQLPLLQSSTVQETGLSSLYCHFSMMTFDF